LEFGTLVSQFGRHGMTTAESSTSSALLRDFPNSVYIKPRPFTTMPDS